jgi:hypothetical protein
MRKFENLSAKKAYKQPVLTVYGTVHNLTKAIFSTSKTPDGGSMPPRNVTGEP